MLYGMMIAKIVLPLLTLPYLTRVLCKDSYGVVSYVKTIMGFAYLIVDYGFQFSATKDIALAGADKAKISKILGDVLVARLMLSGIAAVVMLAMALSIDMLRPFVIFTMLSFAAVFTTIFLFDYYFRGIEEMEVITYRYLIMRSISVALTFVFVHGDADILWIPVLEIVGSLVAVGFVLREIRRRGCWLGFSGLGSAFAEIKRASIYFLSSAAAMTFGLLTTLLIGIYLPARQVAEWGLCYQMVMVVNLLYSPVADSLYPHMVKNRDVRFALKIIGSFMVVVALGCVFTWFVAEPVLCLVGGEKYGTAAPLLRSFIPLMFFSFPAICFGWPMLGAIGGVKETTSATVVTGVLQISGIVVLVVGNLFSVYSMALLRGLCDMFLMSLLISMFAIKVRKPLTWK